MGDSKLSFSTELWDGFDTCMTRMSRGRHDVKETKRYMEERALIEDTYAKSLKKSKYKDQEEKTSLSASWSKTLHANEQIAKHHEQLAVVCNEIAAALENLSNEIKSVRTKSSDKHTRLMAEKKRRIERHDRCKKQYYEAVKQAETAHLNLEAGKTQNLPEKSLQKLERTKKAALKLVDDSHDAYKKSVTSLQEIQEEYDKSMAVILQELEVLEVKRLTVMKEQAIRFSQSHDFLKSSIEQMALLLHEGTGAVKIEQDLHEFIKSNITGKSPPEHVQYKPQSSDIIQHMVDGKSSGTSPASSPAPSPFKTMGSTSSLTTGAGAAPPPHAPPGGRKPPPPAGGEQFAKALYDFESEEPDDLNFPVDAMIKLLQHPDSEDWWQGEYNGKRGMFPKNYVERCAAPLQRSESKGPPPKAPVPAGPPPSAGGPPGPPPVSSAHHQQAAGGGGAPPPGAGGDSPKVMNAKCEALFDFDGQDNDDLSFQKGDVLIITGELDGWYLGKTVDGTRTGIFPSNYVKLK